MTWEIICIPDKLSVRSQSDDGQPAHNMLYTLYLGADSPVSKIISLLLVIKYALAY